MKGLKRVAVVLLSLVLTLSFALPAQAYSDAGTVTIVKSAKVKGNGYTLSQKAGTYKGQVKVTLKAKKGYRVYWSYNKKKFKLSHAVMSGMSKTFNIKSTKTIYVYAVKNTKTLTQSQLKAAGKKYAKKYKYKITAASTVTIPVTDNTTASSAQDTQSSGNNTSTDNNNGGSGSNDENTEDNTAQPDTSEDYVDVESLTTDAVKYDSSSGIVEAGTYVVNNELIGTEKSIQINPGNSTVTGEINIILDNVKIDNSENTGKDPVIYIGKGTSVVNIILKGDNALTGYGSYDQESASGIIQAHKKSEVQINISAAEKGASLTLTDSNSDSETCGIVTKKGNLTIASGNITINSTGGDAINVKAGTYEQTGGCVDINECGEDGVQAEYVNISGGQLDIQTVYEYAGKDFYNKSLGTGNYNTYDESGSTKTEVTNVDTGSHKGIKAGTKAETYVYETVKEGSDNTAGTEYTQDASGGITISGGTINIDTTAAGLKAGSVSGSYTSLGEKYIIGSPDDGISSNNTIDNTGGTINIAASDNGITCATVAESSNTNTTSGAGTIKITGGTVNITECYEGIEGQDIIIGALGASTGPDISIYSNDDGINASSKTVKYTFSDEDKTVETKVSTSVSGNTCTVYSGTLKVEIGDETSHSRELQNDTSTVTITYTSDGDGIDCNGSLYIYGGETTVFGSTSGSNSSIDVDDYYVLGKGATVFTAGTNMGSEYIPTTANQPYITYGSSSSQGGGGFGHGQSQSSSGSISAGSLTITYGSQTLYSTTLLKAVGTVFYSSPSLVSGTSYTVTSGSTSGTATAGTSSASSSGPQQPGGQVPGGH